MWCGIFLLAAKPPDLGTLGVVFLLVVVGGTFFGFPCAVFQRCVQKLPDLLISSQKPSNILQRCVQDLPDFTNPPPSNISRGAFKEVCSKRCIEHTSGNVAWEVILRFSQIMPGTNAADQ